MLVFENRPQNLRTLQCVANSIFLHIKINLINLKIIELINETYTQNNVQNLTFLMAFVEKYRSYNYSANKPNMEQKSFSCSNLSDFSPSESPDTKYNTIFHYNADSTSLRYPSNSRPFANKYNPLQYKRFVPLNRKRNDTTCDIILCILVYYIAVCVIGFIIWSFILFPYRNSYMTLNSFETVTFSQYNKYYTDVQFSYFGNKAVNIYNVPSDNKLNMVSHKTSFQKNYAIDSYNYNYETYWLNKGSSVDISAKATYGSEFLILNQNEFNEWTNVNNDAHYSSKWITNNTSTLKFKSWQDNLYYFVFSNARYNTETDVDVFFQIFQMYADMLKYNPVCNLENTIKCTRKLKDNKKIIISTPLIHSDTSYKVYTSLTKRGSVVKFFVSFISTVLMIPLLALMLIFLWYRMCDNTRMPISSSDFKSVRVTSSSTFQ